MSEVSREWQREWQDAYRWFVDSNFIHIMRTILFHHDMSGENLRMPQKEMTKEFKIPNTKINRGLEIGKTFGLTDVLRQGYYTVYSLTEEGLKFMRTMDSKVGKSK